MNRLKKNDSSFDTQAVFEELKHSQKKAFLILGGGGVGKSYFLNEKLKTLYSLDELILVGPTGTSARHINGKTINAFFNIDIHRKEKFIPQKTIEKIKTAKGIVVDEISMCSYVLINQIDLICRRIRQNCSEPFGGLIFYGFGDTSQLPPVPNEDSKYEKDYDGYQLMFYKADIFKKPDTFSVYLFTHIWCQKDVAFQNLLTRIRNGTTTKEDLVLINRNFSLQHTIDPNSVTLTTTNRTANIINERTLNSLDKKNYYSRTTFDNEDKLAYRLMEKNHIPETIPLAEGIPVIFYRNDMDKNYSEIRYSNGTFGTILKLITQREEILSVFVELDNGDKFEIMKQKFPLEIKTGENEYEQINAAYNFPLKPAYALTISKVQGLSISRPIKILLGRRVEPNLCYVALSRATDISNITVIGRPIIKENLRMRDDFQNHVKKFGWPIKTVY